MNRTDNVHRKHLMNIKKPLELFSLYYKDFILWQFSQLQMMVHLPSGLLALFISCTLGDVYSPGIAGIKGPLLKLWYFFAGSPGAPWSTDTQKIVKAKLYRIFSPHQSLSLYKDLHPEAEEVTDNSIRIEGVEQKWESMPNSAKVLRLGFHGCFPWVLNI